MKVSQLIKELQKAQDEYGDLPVNHHADSRSVYSVYIYTETGNEPKGKSDAVEIFLH